MHAPASPHMCRHTHGQCRVLNPSGRGLTFEFYGRDTWCTVISRKNQVGPRVSGPVRRVYGSTRLSAPVERYHVTHAGSAALLRSPVDAWQSLSLSYVCFKFPDVSAFDLFSSDFLIFQSVIHINDVSSRKLYISYSTSTIYFSFIFFFEYRMS